MLNKKTAAISSFSQFESYQVKFFSDRTKKSLGILITLKLEKHAAARPLRGKPSQAGGSKKQAPKYLITAIKLELTEVNPSTGSLSAITFE